MEEKFIIFKVVKHWNDVHIEEKKIIKDEEFDSEREAEDYIYSNLQPSYFDFYYIQKIFK